MRMVATLMLGLLTGGVVAVVVWASVTQAPWEAGIPTATPIPRPYYTESDVMGLAKQAIAKRSSEWRANEKRMGCTSASYRPNLVVWMVECKFYEDDAATKVSRTVLYQVDDFFGAVK